MTERKYPIIIHPLSFSRKLYYEAYYNRGNHLYWKCHQRNPIILFGKILALCRLLQKLWSGHVYQLWSHWYSLPLWLRDFFWARSSDKYSGLKHLNPEDLSGDNGESSTLIGIAERWEQLRHIYLLTRQYKKHRKPWIFVVTQEPIALG